VVEPGTVIISVKIDPSVVIREVSRVIPVVGSAVEDAEFCSDVTSPVPLADADGSDEVNAGTSEDAPVLFKEEEATGVVRLTPIALVEVGNEL
jgi:hypothetical protein